LLLGMGASCVGSEQQRQEEAGDKMRR
jgi:hypothetical protein